MNSYFRKALLFGLICFLFVPSSMVLADIFIKQKQHTDPISIMGQGQPAKDVIQSTWITQDKIRTDDEKRSVIMLLKEGVIYILNHEKKTYMVMPLNMGQAMEEKMGREGMSDEEQEDFRKFSEGMMKMEITVTETDETRKINNWNCKKYIQKIEMGMGPTTSEIWATQDLRMDYDLYAQFSASLMSMQPGLQKSVSRAIEEMKKIKGVPVLTHTVAKMMGMEMKSFTELLEFKEGTAPAGTFDIPKGYTKTEF
ncbi:MAG: hypothetical protein Kow0042_02410 [Calditrichia bacterium]